MLAPVRHQQILEYLEKNQVATTTRLGELTGASPATIRRDLHALAGRGLIRKTHGGAQALTSPAEAAALKSSVLAPAVPEPEYDASIEDKNAIAQRASELVASDDIIFVGAGMTCNLLCRHLRESASRNITVVTSNVTAVMELSGCHHVHLFLLGGDIHFGKNHVETLEDYSVSTLKRLYFNKAFITVDGVDLQNGYSILNREQLSLYNYLMLNSNSLYVLLNREKYDRRTFVHLCGMQQIRHVITNKETGDKYRRFFLENGVDAIYV